MSASLARRPPQKPPAPEELELESFHNLDPDADGAPTPKAGPKADPEADAAALDVINHLLWHKALIDEHDGGERLDDYITLVRASEEGEHLSIKDPFNKSIAIAFELVLQEHLNPWKIDLGQFSRMYLKRAQEEELDLVTAGRIILMAWTVLKLQSDAMLELAERLAAPPEPEMEMLEWGDIGDWDYDDEGMEYTRRVKYAPEAPIDEKVRRKGSSRKVTLMELVEAFEEVRREAEERRVVMVERARLREILRERAGRSVEEMMHNDDPEADQAGIWERILALNGSPIPLARLHEPQIDPFVTAFTSVLFLAADRKVDVWQEDFPYGPILIKNLLGAAHTPDDEDVAARAREGPAPSEPSTSA